jgi:Na+-transporting NADH:ubiquinone oxidoreductase subunit NqrA
MNIGKVRPLIVYAIMSAPEKADIDIRVINKGSKRFNQCVIITVHNNQTEKRHNFRFSPDYYNDQTLEKFIRRLNYIYRALDIE